MNNLVHRTPRSIIGFSVRRHPRQIDNADATYKSDLLIVSELKFPIPLSLWFQVWDVVNVNELELETNAANLLYLPDTFGIDGIDATSSCLISADLAVPDAERLSNRFGFYQIPLGFVKSSKYWMFLGYDVVSFGGLFSAIYGMDWSGDALRVVGNSYGLIVNGSDADAVACRANEVLSDHPPFYSVGIWVKILSQEELWLK